MDIGKHMTTTTNDKVKSENKVTMNKWIERYENMNINKT